MIIKKGSIIAIYFNRQTSITGVTSSCVIIRIIMS
jgi:hypothetical protein